MNDKKIVIKIDTGTNGQMNSIIKKINAENPLFMDERITNELRQVLDKFEESLKSIKQSVQEENNAVVFKDLFIVQIDNFLESINNFRNLNKSDYFKNLIKICRRLSKREKEIFYYLYVKKMDIADIRKLLGIKETTIKTYLNRINLKFEKVSYSQEALKSELAEKPNCVSDNIFKKIIDYTEILK